MDEPVDPHAGMIECEALLRQLGATDPDPKKPGVIMVLCQGAQNVELDVLPALREINYYVKSIKRF